MIACGWLHHFFNAHFSEGRWDVLSNTVAVVASQRDAMLVEKASPLDSPNCELYRIIFSFIPLNMISLFFIHSFVLIQKNQKIKAL